MRRNRTVVALALALVAGCKSRSPIDPTAYGTVTVTVVDQNGAAVGNALVEIDAAATVKSGPLGTTYTSTNGSSGGKAVFVLVAPGSHAIWCSPPLGYAGGGTSTALTVDVIADDVALVQLTLTKT